VSRLGKDTGAKGVGLVIAKPGRDTWSASWSGSWPRDQRDLALAVAAQAISSRRTVGGSVLAIPVVMRERCVAAVCVHGMPDGAELGRAALRSSGAAAVVHEATFEMVAWEATTDGLTMLASPRAIRARLAAVLAETVEPVGLLMLDVDHFRRFNEQFGHEVGNQALTAVANAIHTAAGPHAEVGRYGGEEFLVILPGAGPLATVQAAERIREAVENDRSLPERVTVSVGCAQFPADADSLGTLVRAADSAMYRAKRGGRNRVEVFEPGMEPLGEDALGSMPLAEIVEALRCIETAQAEVADEFADYAVSEDQRRCLVASRVVAKLGSSGLAAAEAGRLLRQLGMAEAPRKRRKKSA
jgi:diguanylate cyclase (GGDEF)-like protein